MDANKAGVPGNGKLTGRQTPRYRYSGTVPYLYPNPKIFLGEGGPYIYFNSCIIIGKSMSIRMLWSTVDLVPYRTTKYERYRYSVIRWKAGTSTTIVQTKSNLVSSVKSIVVDPE